MSRSELCTVSPSLRYQLVMMKPRDFPYVEGFREIIETLRSGFADLGFECRSYINYLDSGVTPILFGAHHLPPEQVANLPSDSIIYNLEQLLEDYPWRSEGYLELLRRFAVWDFSPANLVQLQNNGVDNARLLPIGYAESLERVPRIVEDVDILFYGVMTPHRQASLARLGEAGLNTVALNGIFGPERDAWIARSRIVLNLHAHPHGLFEAPRVCHLLANHKTVVCECVDPAEIDADLLPGIAATRTDRIAETCRYLLENPAERYRIAAEGYRAMTAPERSIVRLLEQVLEVPTTRSHPPND